MTAPQLTTRRHVLRGLAAAAACVAAWPLHAQTTAAADPLAELGRRLTSPPVLRGDFEQTKTLKGFKRPLVSRGAFVMARGRGVHWATREPFASTIVVTRDRIRTLDATGGNTVETRQEPGLRMVNDLLIGLLAGDVKALASRFQADLALEGARGWRLTLLPRDANLARFVTRIELQGDEHVKQVHWTEASGDDTRIRFSNHRLAPLSEAESAWFD
ncbi:MAG TPA: outer membrane lipoprotein carrier protein LolA [Candidatus Aquabacterium excrementipullorum]|nr:outer membrane lipoprotein carrier protein LolA [Candidatus Aquabacterium excrementipullorum]